MPRGRATSPPDGKIDVCGSEVERRDEPGAERQRGDLGQIVQAGVAGQAEHRARADFLLQIGGGRVVRLDQRRAQRHLIDLVAVGIPGLHSGFSGADT